MSALQSIDCMVSMMSVKDATTLRFGKYSLTALTVCLFALSLTRKSCACMEDFLLLLNDSIRSTKSFALLRSLIKGYFVT